MGIYSSLMGDNLAELVLQSPYPQDDCAGHELWAVTGYISRTTILSALYQADFTPGRRSKEAGHWGEMSKFTPTSTTPKIHLLVGMARDGAVSITTHEILKGWARLARVPGYSLPGSSRLSPGSYQALRLGTERLFRYCLRWLS